jgi:hypothetical protein
MQRLTAIFKVTQSPQTNKQTKEDLIQYSTGLLMGFFT